MSSANSIEIDVNELSSKDNNPVMNAFLGKLYYKLSRECLKVVEFGLVSKTNNSSNTAKDLFNIYGYSKDTREIGVDTKFIIDPKDYYHFISAVVFIVRELIEQELIQADELVDVNKDTNNIINQLFGNSVKNTELLQQLVTFSVKQLEANTSEKDLEIIRLNSCLNNLQARHETIVQTANRLADENKDLSDLRVELDEANTQIAFLNKQIEGYKQANETRVRKSRTTKADKANAEQYLDNIVFGSTITDSDIQAKDIADKIIEQSEKNPFPTKTPYKKENQMLVLISVAEPDDELTTDLYIDININKNILEVLTLNNLHLKQQDLDVDFAKIINDDFWDMVEAV